MSAYLQNCCETYIVLNSGTCLGTCTRHWFASPGTSSKTSYALEPAPEPAPKSLLWLKTLSFAAVDLLLSAEERPADCREALPAAPPQEAVRLVTGQLEPLDLQRQHRKSQLVNSGIGTRHQISPDVFGFWRKMQVAPFVLPDLNECFKFVWFACLIFTACSELFGPFSPVLSPVPS